MKELDVAKQQMVQHEIVKRLYKDSKLSDENLSTIEQLLHDFIFATINEYLIKNDLLEDESDNSELDEIILELEGDTESKLTSEDLRRLIRQTIREMLDSDEGDEDDETEDWKKN